MSIEHAKAFYQRMTEDRAFRESLEQLLEQASSDQERRQLIIDAGYDFTTEELQATMTDVLTSDYEGELKEEDLEAVAGGGWCNKIYGSVKCYW